MSKYPLYLTLFLSLPPKYLQNLPSNLPGAIDTHNLGIIKPPLFKVVGGYFGMSESPEV